MNKFLIGITCFLFLPLIAKAQHSSLNANNQSQLSYSKDSAKIDQIFDYVLDHGKAYNWLDYLANQIGGRLSGSPEAAMAVEWSKQLMESLDFDTVWLQEVMVPHWVRGKKESARIINSKTLGSHRIRLCALGGSVATSELGLTAEVVEIKSWEELEIQGKRKRLYNKIVFFNTEMEQKHPQCFTAYGESVSFRVAGASRAAKYGAVGMVLRSLSTVTDTFPHTGVMYYDAKVSPKKIPAAALATSDAVMLSKLLKEDKHLKINMQMNCQTLPDELSYNVIGEWYGSSPNGKIIAVGGHLDAWDNGDGAHDDGAGCVQSIEAVMALKKIGYKPKHNIRAVLFMNEENGTQGGRMYAAEAARKGEKHLVAIESDAGGFSPRGFSIDADANYIEHIASFRPLLEQYGIHRIQEGFGGADIRFLKEQGVVLIGLRPDSQRYFDYHHAASDTFDKVNRRELHLGTGAMAALIYLIDMYELGAVY